MNIVDVVGRIAAPGIFHTTMVSVKGILAVKETEMAEGNDSFTPYPHQKGAQPRFPACTQAQVFRCSDDKFMFDSIRMH